MAATGEECFYQKPIQTYFDSSYDILFDPNVEHYCAYLDKTVIPAQCCGTSCPAFKPMYKNDTQENQSQHRTVDTTSPSARDAHFRDFLRRHLDSICDQLWMLAVSLEQQAQKQTRRWQQRDAWLRREDTQLERLAREVAIAEQALSATLSAQEQAEQRPHPSVRHRDSRELQQFRFRQQQWAVRVKYARLRIAHTKSRMAARAQLEATQEQLRARWEETNERLRLVKHLRSEVMRCIKPRLTDANKPLTEADRDRILSLLQDVSVVAQGAADSVPIATLRKKVEALAQRASHL